ncbi:hypothetical protein [Pontimicrobium aquaticum]|uniref:Uncharacterized protein n=1 Tax=Pontimicrobium aquaticum TaxID=2565367 RepID=A0A4U0ESM6_9FLAO|nr:hypothetical protein [Pontimicrobium aquaticum]TJY34777.1 hypothetical protein E5167_10745 [Pontimicrobium aquaticum]
MSKNLPEQQPSEEIDLGQLFKLIGNAFERFFRFIGSIFNAFFLAFVWVVFFTKKHVLKLVVAGVIGVVLGIVKQKTEVPVYKSTIVVKQNYNTGQHLYNTIEHYNSLLAEKDSISISQLLQIEPHEANMLQEFELESVLSENQKMELFNEYTEGLDSVIAQTVTFKDFISNSNEFEHSFQKITLLSKEKNNFKKILKQIVTNVSSNEFFKNEQKKDLNELNRREEIINESLRKSDSLQKVYREVLEKSAEKVAGGTTSITFEGADDKSVTKEFELYKNDIELGRELVEINREKENASEILEVVSIQNDKGTISNASKLFGLETSWTISLTIKIVLALYLVLLLLEFLKFLERYKDKVQ